MSIVFMIIAFGVILFVLGMILTIVNITKTSKSINNMQNNFFQKNVICPRCQKEIDSNLSYCHYCGYSFK